MDTLNRTIALMLRVAMRRYREIVIGTVAVATAFLLHGVLVERDQAVMSSSATITQEFSGVRNSAMLVDFCYRLQELPGVTAVSVQKWHSEQQSATITVYYNSHELSPRQIRVYLYNSKIIWTESLST